MKGDVNEVKESVELVHNLLNDEVKNRQTDINHLKNEMADCGKEASQNLQLIKNHTSQLKVLGDSAKNIKSDVDRIGTEQKNLISLMNKLKHEVEELVGAVEFPVKCIIVAQNIWCKEGENLD